LAKGEHKPSNTLATAKRNKIENAFMSRRTVSPPGRRVNPLGLKMGGGAMTMAAREQGQIILSLLKLLS
jgi:hypothetical protein